MKVVIVIPYFYPRVGGAEVYTLNIARRLQSLGWTVVVVTTGNYDSKKIAIFDGIKIYRLNSSFTLSNTPIGFGWRRKLIQIFKDEQPDIINAHTPVPYLADIAERASKAIPFVLTYHNDLEKDSLPYKAIAKLLNLTLIRRTLRRSTGIITTSEYYVRESRYLKEYRSKISIVPPGVDLSRFNPRVTISDELVLRYQHRRVILFVGSINRSHRHKGLDTLIEAFARLHQEFPETKLVIVGQGDGLDDYKSMVAAAGVREDVDFAGYVADQELPEYYKLASVFAMPSTNRSEGFGMVYLEASAVGTPVIGSRVGGVPYAVKDNETGLLIQPRSVDSLHESLRTLLTNESFASRLGAAGAVRARAEFSWELIAERTGKVFSSLIARSTDGARTSLTYPPIPPTPRVDS